MGLAGFNRSRRRLAEEHKKRLEAQKVIKKPVKKDKVIKVTDKTDIEKAAKELTEVPFSDYEPSKEEEKIIEEHLENTRLVGEQGPEFILKTSKTKKKSKKE